MSRCFYLVQRDSENLTAKLKTCVYLEICLHWYICSSICVQICLNPNVHVSSAMCKQKHLQTCLSACAYVCEKRVHVATRHVCVIHVYVIVWCVSVGSFVCVVVVWRAWWQLAQSQVSLGGRESQAVCSFSLLSLRASSTGTHTTGHTASPTHRSSASNTAHSCCSYRLSTRRQRKRLTHKLFLFMTLALFVYDMF